MDVILPLPPRVVLAGWYGAANFGDEMLLATIAGWVRAAGGSPVAVSVHPDYTRRTLGIDAISGTDLAEIVPALANADLFVLGGGGLFQDYNRLDANSLEQFPAYDATRFAQYFHLAAQLGVPTVALAQGVGPLRSDASRTVTADVFRDAGHVSVRDRASEALLAEIGVTRSVPVGADPAWMYPVAPAALEIRALVPELRDRKVLGVSLRHWPFDPDWEHPIADSFASALPADWATVWIDFQRTPSQDGTVLAGDEIASRMTRELHGRGVHVAHNPASMSEALTALGSCDAIVAMRLHAALFAHRAGKPVVTLEYDGKVRALGDALGHSRAARVSLSEIPGRLAGAIAAITGPERDRLVVSPETVRAMAEDAQIHRRILEDAMAAATRDHGNRPRGVPPLLSKWLERDPAIAARVMRALEAG